MSAESSTQTPFEVELASIVGLGGRSPDARSRHELFAALSRLEKRALIGGGSDEILKSIAEARFVAGILRDAVRPTRLAGLHTVLKSRRAARAVQGRDHRGKVEDTADPA